MYLILLIFFFIPYCQGNGLGGGSSATVGGGGGSEGRKSTAYDKEGTLEKGGGISETIKRRDTIGATMSSQTSRSSLEDSYSAEREARKRDNVATLTQNFCPVTLTVNGFFRQVIPVTLRATRIDYDNTTSLK